jgi:hypothetical protein
LSSASAVLRFSLKRCAVWNSCCMSAAKVPRIVIYLYLIPLCLYSKIAESHIVIKCGFFHGSEGAWMDALDVAVFLNAMYQ